MHVKTKPNSLRSTKRRSPSGRATVNSLEGRVVELAKNGKLAGAARRAIRTQRAKGLTVTYQRGSAIVKEHPNGRIEVLARLPRSPRYTLPKGVRIISNG